MQQHLPLMLRALGPGHPSALRLYIQLSVFAFFIYTFWQFSAYHLWVSGLTTIPAVKPPTIEAILPIQATIAAKRYFISGEYDYIHPAGLSIFLLALILAFFTRRSFCSYLCPVGFCQEAFSTLGKQFGLTRRPGKITNFLVSLPKYFILAFFIWVVIINMTDNILNNPTNLVAENFIWIFFSNPSRELLITIIIIGFASLFVQGFWCRGFCPYGALLGLISFFSPIAVNRNKANCSYCRKCYKSCPQRIAVFEKTVVRSPECIGCSECINVCPEKNCLILKCGYGKLKFSVPKITIAVMCLVILTVGVLLAQADGKWVSKFPVENVKQIVGNW